MGLRIKHLFRKIHNLLVLEQQIHVFQRLCEEEALRTILLRRFIVHIPQVGVSIVRAAVRIDSLPHLPAPLAIDRVARDLVQVVHRLQRLGPQNVVRRARVHRGLVPVEEHSLRRDARLRAPVHQVAAVRQSLRVLQIALRSRGTHVVQHAQRQHAAHEAGQMAHLRLERAARALLAAVEKPAGAAPEEPLGESVDGLVVHLLERLGVMEREEQRTLSFLPLWIHILRRYS